MSHSASLRWQTRRILEKAGWYAGRSVDTLQWSAELSADGFPRLHPTAVTFWPNSADSGFRPADRE